MKSPLANWNGLELPLEEVKVSVLDRGFLFGDAVYEVVRIYGGRLFRIDDHLARMRLSLDYMKIADVDIAIIRERILRTVEAAQVTDGLAYIQVTRGEAPRTHRYPQHSVPNILIYVDNFVDPYAQFRETGVSAVTHSDIRWRRNDIKATSLAANCMAAQFAYEQGCAEVIFIDSNGLVTEGSHTSIFGVRGNTILVAPASTNVLPGITKKLVLDLAAAGDTAISEQRISESELFQLDEIFLAATPEEILSIVKVNRRRTIGSGSRGPVVKKLQVQFEQLKINWLSETARTETTPR